MISSSPWLTRLLVVAATVLGPSASVATAQVGHLDDAHPSNSDWAASIVLAGELPIHITDISTLDFSSLRALCINIGAGGPSAALLARVPDLTTWVTSGGALVYHDRTLGTNAMLPGGGAVSLNWLPSGDINVVTTGTLVTDGPGGMVRDSTLDSWTATTNGYATNLPVGAINILSNGPSPSGSTGFVYPVGLGSVYYASMPLDFYLAGLGPPGVMTAMSTIYAPNLVAYAVDGASSPAVIYCSGDGTGTACPCGNAGGADRGCGNSADVNGAAMVASGYASIGVPTLALAGSGLVPGQAGMFFQGNVAVNGGAGVLFGDGLRCAGTSVVRLEVVIANGSGESLSTVNLAVAGGVAAGDSRAYQLWYRDSVGSPCGFGFNTSNGVLLTWAP